uniref:2-alkenal reductase (NAD(P)(+)) n=1 Tax=Opuntia streptacantha TaxID=393608 RepID=A0A7C8ZVH1_OPUST
MSVLKIFFLIACIQINFIVGDSTKPKVNHRKSFWPWQSGSSCFPFWPYGCHTGRDPPPTSPQLPLSTPIVPPPTALTPKVLPPASQLAPSISATLVFVDQRLAVVYPVIQKFKSIITSDPLGITKTWVGSDICSYQGFFCDIPPDNASATAVASIDFNGFGLTAPTIDGFIDQLPDLALFHANSNNFGATVSSNIAKLKYLYELDLSNNKFTGPFPQAVLAMEGLTFLDIRFNLFSGMIPPAIFTQNLEVLFLNDNNFLSTLPPTLGNTHILYLTLANNKFSGPIPHDIVKALSALNEVLLLNNQLTGCLPYELGFLNQVTVFDISNNLLSGPLPFSLACLQRVELLDFSSNFLYGMVPDILCQLPSLGNLSLSNNYFTQVGPYCRMLISQGVLDVRNNCIPDLPFQRSLVECTAFFATPHFCPYSETYSIIPCKPYFHH